MKKTLGGDRLGSGKKNSVELQNYERSTHDLGYIWRSSASPGTLIPFLVQLALPGDTFDIDLQSVVLTHPTLGPLFGSYKEQLDVFQAPIRLYQAALHNNTLGIGLNMSSILLPQITLRATPTDPAVTDTDNSQINPSCIFSYLGIRGIGQTLAVETRDFNAVPYLAYYDIYKNYYANKQEGTGVVIHTPLEALVSTITSISTEEGTIAEAPATDTRNFTPTPDVLTINYTGTTPIPSQVILNTSEYGDLLASQVVLGFNDTGTALISISGSQWGSITINNWRYKTISDTSTIEPQLVVFPLENIDTMRTNILTQAITSAYKINETTIEPYGLPMYTPNIATTAQAMLCSQEGLACKTYQSDLFNNWLRDEWIANINTISAIDTTAGSITVDTIILARKVYDMLNQIAVSGGSYDDWQDAVWNHPRYRACTTPMYMGGLSKEVIFQQVVSNSAADTNGNQPLGTLGGRGHMSDKHKGGKITIKVDEPSYIIGLVSLTPRIDYSQGNKWDTHLTTMDDLHKPALDEIGFQDLITEQMHWYSTKFVTTWEQQAAGKQPAWINYMTEVNRVYGSFAIEKSEMFMVLNRRYEINSGAISDLTTYIDPAKFNFIFADTAIDAQNFWIQIAVDITARRKMSAKVMPHL